MADTRSYVVIQKRELIVNATSPTDAVLQSLGPFMDNTKEAVEIDIRAYENI